MILATTFWHNTQRRNTYICAFKMTIAEIYTAIMRLGGEEGVDGVVGEVRIKALFPEEYHEFLTMFTEAVYNILLPHHIYNYSILLKERCQLPFGPLYSLS